MFLLYWRESERKREGERERGRREDNNTKTGVYDNQTAAERVIKEEKRNREEAKEKERDAGKLKLAWRAGQGRQCSG
jgi:hypothetical protein